MKTVYQIIISTAIIASVSCRPQTQTETETAHVHAEAISLTEKQLEAVDIRFGEIEQRNLNNVIRVTGEMLSDPQEKADVHSLTGGIVRQILVTEGNDVSKGQVLAYLENTGIVELQKDYLTAKKELLVAEQEYNRQKDLATQGAGTEKTLQQITAAHEIAKARTTGLEKQLQQLSISPAEVSVGNMVTQIPLNAPIAGTVSKINVNTGSYVDIQTSLMHINDNSRIHCDLHVFEKDIQQVSIGQEVDMTITNMSGTLLKGIVYEINKSFDSETKTITVHASIPDRKHLKLLPGMYVSALINIGIRKTDAVPDDAIVSMDGKKYIFQLEDDVVGKDGKSFHLKRLEVITGISELGYTQITVLDDVAADAKIVQSNAFYIASMMASGEEE
jgi:RND family efflux transporter MFP subunit